MKISSIILDLILFVGLVEIPNFSASEATDVCQQPRNPGILCISSTIVRPDLRWFYRRGHCWLFLYLGCNGNDNNFLTKQECTATCRQTPAGDADSSDYSFQGDRGPENWPDLFPMCNGKRQSPINLQPPKLTPLQRDLLFTNYDDIPINIEIQNTGYTAESSITSDNIPMVTGGGLLDPYKLKQFHFHWGPDDFVGSEHTINGVRYPLEMHLVHYNARYGSFENALTYGTYRKPSLLVMAVFFEISDADNQAFASIIDALDDIKNYDQKTPIELTNSMRSLLPEDVYRFFKYKGSLTTPPCSEIVHWLIFTRPVTISSSQLEKFRILEDEDGNPITQNFRPIQDLNGRKVRNIKTRLIP